MYTAQWLKTRTEQQLLDAYKYAANAAMGAFTEANFGKWEKRALAAKEEMNRRAEAVLVLP